MGGDDGDSDEPGKKKKKLQLDTTLSSSSMANNSLQSPDNKTVEAAALQQQNQKLFQQLEAKKSEVHVLEAKFKELREKQIAYDQTLININKLWNQLVDDLIILESQIGGDPTSIQTLALADASRDTIPLCSPEETFLYRLLESYPAAKIVAEPNGGATYVQQALTSRRLSTVDLMKHLEETIATQRAKTEKMAAALHGKLSSEDTIIELQKIDNSLREEGNNLQKAVDYFDKKHKQYADDIQSYLKGHLIDQSEIQRLSAELEECMAELEESRRKLVSLKMQKDGGTRMHAPVLSVVNGSSSPDKHSDRNVGLREMKSSVEETKKIAAARLVELEEAQQEDSILSKQLAELEERMKDEKYILSSKPYLVMNSQLQLMNLELERYKGLIESLQAERNNTVHKEKELTAKAESAEAARAAISTADAQRVELELQLQRCTIERNDLEIKLEEALQDAGRKDIKDEIHVMASALTNEMELMEAQLNRYKEAACEACSLREEAHSLDTILNRKISEHKSLSDRCAEQTAEIKILKALVEKLEREKNELSIFLDMYGQECFDNRTMSEIHESEHRAEMQTEALKTALDEHSLELRVKAANEAEAACQQRLSAAETEIADLRTELDASEREILELTEAIRVKDLEAEAYISEIEAIGQAYEDMQVQNQHLSQQVAERDDYNTKLVSESLKMKQAHSCLLSEKQSMAKQLHQVNTSVDYFKTRITRGEDQVKALLSQASKASSEKSHLTISTDNAKLELAIAEEELKWLSSAVDTCEKELKNDQQSICKMRAELEAERNERRRLEEELEELKAEVDEMSTEKREAAIQKLQEEIKECKAILKCGVCFDRPKEVVITKCFHLFCSPCIQRNLEIRHRRCPGCGTAFGQNDVREVNI